MSTKEKVSVEFKVSSTELPSLFFLLSEFGENTTLSPFSVFFNIYTHNHSFLFFSFSSFSAAAASCSIEVYFTDGVIKM